MRVKRGKLINGASANAQALAFLKRYPRMPKARQKRLHDLLDKSQAGVLTSAESRELRGMVRAETKASIAMLAGAVAEMRRAEISKAAERRARIPA